jgi:hypothetical protein
MMLKKYKVNTLKSGARKCLKIGANNTIIFAQLSPMNSSDALFYNALKNAKSPWKFLEHEMC